MGRNQNSSAVIDGLLRLALSGGILATVLIAPNAVQALDKPTRKYLQHLDKRARERKLKKLAAYMKYKGLIKGNYEHGLNITDKGRERLKRAAFDNLSIQKPKKWDKNWRIVFYDIPEEKKIARNALSLKLRQTGFQQLQRSVWVHPFPCRQEIEIIALNHEVERYITYIETTHIDKQKALIERFNSII